MARIIRLSYLHIPITQLPHNQSLNTPNSTTPNTITQQIIPPHAAKSPCVPTAGCSNRSRGKMQIKRNAEHDLDTYSPSKLLRNFPLALSPRARGATDKQARNIYKATPAHAPVNYGRAKIAICAPELARMTARG